MALTYQGQPLDRCPIGLQPTLDRREIMSGSENLAIFPGLAGKIKSTIPTLLEQSTSSLVSKLHLYIHRCLATPYQRGLCLQQMETIIESRKLTQCRNRCIRENPATGKTSTLQFLHLYCGMGYWFWYP